MLCLCSDIEFFKRKIAVEDYKLIQLITDGNRKGVEYELIMDKCSFARMVSQEPERLEEISQTFSRMTRELHSVKADTSRLPEEAFQPLSQLMECVTDF